MYRIKNDQRSIRSGEMLYNGLAQLMRVMSFDSIRVKDLVEAAQVGRTTFYRNFDEIEDILGWRCDKVFDGLIEYLVKYARRYGMESRTALLKPLLRYFYLHSEIIELLMLAKRLDIAHASFRRVLQPFKMQTVERINVDEDISNYGIAIRTSVTISILVHWIEGGKKEAPDELANRLSAMMKDPVRLEQLLELSVMDSRSSPR